MNRIAKPAFQSVPLESLCAALVMPACSVVQVSTWTKMYILLTRAKIVVLDLTVMFLALSRAKIVIPVCSQVQQEVLVLPPARIAPLAKVLQRWE